MESSDQQRSTSFHLDPATSSVTQSVKSSSNSNRATDEISIKDLITQLIGLYKYLRSKWLVISLTAIIGGVLGLTYAWLQKPIYTATTTFVLESGDGTGAGIGQYAELASMVGIDLGGGGGGIFQGDNIIELYKSRKMIEKTLFSEITDKSVHKQLLVDRYIDFNKLRKKWESKPQLSNINFSSQSDMSRRVKDSIISEIVEDINKTHLTVAKPDKKLSIIEVEVKSKDEIFARSFNEQIVKNVNDFYVATKTKKSLENVTILQQKTDSVNAVMNGAIYKTASVADATPNINPTRQLQRVVPMQRSQFTAETNRAILGELVKNLEMSKIALRKETPLIQVVDEPVYPLDKEVFSKTKGIILGTFVAVILIVIILLVNRILQDIMS